MAEGTRLEADLFVGYSTVKVRNLLGELEDFLDAHRPRPGEGTAPLLLWLVERGRPGGDHRGGVRRSLVAIHQVRDAFFTYRMSIGCALQAAPVGQSNPQQQPRAGTERHQRGERRHQKRTGGEKRHQERTNPDQCFKEKERQRIEENQQRPTKRRQPELWQQRSCQVRRILSEGIRRSQSRRLRDKKRPRTTTTRTRGWTTPV